MLSPPIARGQAPPSQRRVSKEDAAKELMARRHGRRNAIDFTTYTFPRYIDDPVHHLIASKLDDIVAGRTRRLILVAPPQHGKSELVSVRLPAYWLGHHPDMPVILTSYSAPLASEKGGFARDLIKSDEYPNLFPKVSIHPSYGARDLWRLDSGYRGSMLSVGRGGPITGRGGMLGIIDDPIRNWEEAQSARVREQLWEWYRYVFRNRLWGGSAMVIIATRWHQDDLIGRLIMDQGHLWEVVRLPALAESQEVRDANDVYMGLPPGQPDPLGRAEGEALSPSRFTIEDLKEIEVDVGPLAWSTGYQGVPRPPEGDFFKLDWFQKKIPSSPPKEKILAIVRYWDLAATEGGGAFTCGVLLAALRTGEYVVLDVVRGQWGTGKRNDRMLETARRDRLVYGRGRVKTYFEKEGGSSGVDAANDIILNLSGFPVYADQVSGDKVTRATPVQSQMYHGNYYLVNAEWTSNYVDEFVAFPNHTYKDQVDATSGAQGRLAPLVRKRKQKTKSQVHDLN